MSSSFQNICRTCMINDLKQQKMSNRSRVKMKTIQMVPIFTVAEDSIEELSLLELLKSTVPQLKIEENDDLPKIVCIDCLEKIKEIYRYQQNCLSVEQKFVRMLEQIGASGSVDNAGIFKMEFEDHFVKESSLQSDDDIIVEDDIKIETASKDEIIENCSDFSMDFVWDEKSGSDWEEEHIESKSKLRKKSKDSKSKLIDDEILQYFCNDDNEDANYKPTSTSKKRSTGRKIIGTQQMYPCDKCNRKLKSKLSLEKHQELHIKQDEQERIYKCNICNKVFEKNYDLKEHLRTHIGELPFLCSDCGKGFNSAGGLKQHSFRHLYKKQFTCPDCPKSFPTKADLVGHINTHKDIPKKHICDVCGRGFKTPFLLKQHKRYHNNDKPFACEFCEKREYLNSEKSEQNLKNGGETDDEEFQTFSYDDDDDEFDEYEPIITKKSDTSKESTTQQLYTCERCKKQLKSKLSLKKHQQMHDKKDNEEPKFVCNICDKAFLQGYMLKDHLRVHSGEKPYLCSECGKGFTSSSSLKQHSYRHLNEKLFACPDCPKTFPTRTDLASHYDVHKARPKSHICDVCGRGFPKPFLLKKHKMYHTNERPFPCEYCDKRFFTNEKLQRHTRIHTGEKPYKCQYCDKAYCQSNELTKHLRCHLGENVYQCELCPLRFPTVKTVREHFTTHKNDDEETKARNLAELNAVELKGIYCR